MNGYMRAGACISILYMFNGATFVSLFYWFYIYPLYITCRRVIHFQSKFTSQTTYQVHPASQCQSLRNAPAFHYNAYIISWCPDPNWGLVIYCRLLNWILNEFVRADHPSFILGSASGRMALDTSVIAYWTSSMYIIRSTPEKKLLTWARWSDAYFAVIRVYRVCF